MSNTHPEHLKKLEGRIAEKAGYAKRLYWADQIAVSEGLKFIHFRPGRTPHGHERRGLTIAYRTPKKHTVQVATAITHPHDTFSKQMGRIVATEHFFTSQRITINFPKDWGVVGFLQEMFRPSTLK